MRRLAIIFFLIIFSVSFSILKAQSDIGALDTVIRPKKPLMLTFGLDANLTNLACSYTHDYTGEYNIYGNGPAGWQWVSHKADYSNIRPYGRFTNIKLDVLIANSKVWQAGLSFNFGSCKLPATIFDVNGQASPTTDTLDVIYAGISLMVEYNYYFNQKTFLGPYAFGGLDIGSYTGTDQVFGPGTPFYLQGRLGVGYNLKGDVMFKAFISSDHLIYNESPNSEVYNRTESLKINLDALYIGLGISKTFTLFPD